MKKAILKASLPISALLLASGLQVAQAHCIGPLSANFATATITAGSTATNQFDQYVVNCPATTLSLRARVSKAAIIRKCLLPQSVIPHLLRRRHVMALVQLVSRLVPAQVLLYR